LTITTMIASAATRQSSVARRTTACSRRPSAAADTGRSGSIRRLVAIAACVLMMSSTTFGDMEKVAIPSDRGFSLHWWPKLPKVPGWFHDREASLQLGVNALVPDASTFVNAETVMYGKAVYKAREPDTKTPGGIVELDKRRFAAHSPGVVLKAAPSLTTADSKRLESFTFFPTSTGNWERVAYGEEDEYYLVFAVSSRSLRGYNASAKSYEGMVGSYKCTRFVPTGSLTRGSADLLRCASQTAEPPR
jgi:hypothetical protein